MANNQANFVYTHLSEIKDEIHRRFYDQNLKRKVIEFWGDYPFPLNLDKPVAFFCRDIATPNKELSYFLDITKELDLQPLVLELHKSKFVSKNKAKYHLGMLHFDTSKSKNTFSKKVVDFNLWEGKNLDKIRTLNDNTLVGFHHEMLIKEYPNVPVYDFSDWFLSTRSMTDHYYFYFLSLFICHGVLFENYLMGDKEESEFYIKNVEPSFRKVEEFFGFRPLIYPLLPIEFEKDTMWYSYPEHLNIHI